MKTAITILAAAGLLLTAASPSFAAKGAAKNSPGHQMNAKGSLKGYPGASGYAPGQVMKRQGSKRGSPGASGYAPGQR